MSKSIATVVTASALLLLASGTSAETKPTPLSVSAIAEHFDACMEGTKASAADPSTSRHYCACMTDHQREFARKTGGKRPRALEIHAGRRCIKYAYNQPKSFGGTVTASDAERKRLSTASIVGQLRQCASDEHPRTRCECAVKQSRERFISVGRKGLLSELGKRRYPDTTCE